MLEALRDVLEPKSLLEVVPEEVLRALMKGFFYGQRAGTVLIYNEGETATDLKTLKRLGPVEPGRPRAEEFEVFNPFCALFRQDPARNALCEACDDDHALKEFKGVQVRRRYTCHMGLTDMTIPIRVNDRVRGVLFGGQKVTRTEPMLQLIRRRIAEKAPDIATELTAKMEEAAIGADELDEFEKRFIGFAKAFQAAVDAFALVRRHEAERATLLSVSEHLSKLTTDDSSGWDDETRPLLQDAGLLFRELEALVNGRPVWLLQRRGSRYACVAASPLGTKNLGVNLPAWVLIETQLETAERLSVGQPALTELRSRMGMLGSEFTVFRSETQIGQSEWVSVALIVGAQVSPQHRDFMIGCARALTYPTGVSWLLRRLHRQQTEFERNASFIWHHMKTPLQVARLAIGEAAQLSDSAADGNERTTLLNEAEVQISLAVADAMRLQASAIAPKRERYDIRSMIEKLIDDMRPLARSRWIVIRSVAQPGLSATVSGEQLPVKVAFSNLLENAIKYSYETKVIDIRLTNPAAGRPGSARQGFIQVEIEDVGVGFPPEEKNRLFNLGTRLAVESGKHARPGTGIGLIQAKEYLEAAGGSLDINSERLPTHTGNLSRVTVLVHLPLV